VTKNIFNPTMNVGIVFVFVTKWKHMDMVTGLYTAFASSRRIFKVWRKSRRESSPSRSFFLQSILSLLVKESFWGIF